MARILDTILAHKRREVRAAQTAVSMRHMLNRATHAPKPRSLSTALRPPGSANSGTPRLIAEIKRRSPSRGPIAEHLDVAQVAKTYEQAGAAAISVLTDAQFFGGSLDDLTAAREATSLPVLRKDFIIAPYQVFEARAAGADAILVIVAAIPNEADVANLIEYAERVGMDTIVEVHAREELTIARKSGAKIIGINNRDLQSFQVDLGTTAALSMMIPEDVIVVSESGVQTAADVRRLYDSGADALLVGEALLADGDPAAKIKELFE